MNARPKAILGYIVGCLLTVCFVVLFTIIFSFVGTLICAALAGMMLGAARLPWWQSLTFSMLFPGVISTYFRVTKADLPASQVLFLSALCFGIFWLIYLALWALTSHEHRGAPVKSAPAKAAVRPVTRSADLEREDMAPVLRAVVPSSSSASEARFDPVPVAPAVTLATLQGNWFGGTPGNGSGNGNGHRRMEIHDDTIVLSLTDELGHVHLAKAHLKLCAHCVFGLASCTPSVCRAPQYEQRAG